MMNFDPVKEKCYFFADKITLPVYMINKLYCLDNPINLL